MVVPVNDTLPQRKAEFLLNNAVDGTDYRKARKEVRKWVSIRIQFSIGDLPRCRRRSGD